VTMTRLYHGLPASSTPHRPVDSHLHPPLSSLSHRSFGDRENEFSYTIKKRQMVVETGEEDHTEAALFYSLAASFPPRQE
jgi:hypothetical protein